MNLLESINLILMESNPFYYSKKFNYCKLSRNFIFHTPNECPAIGKPKTRIIEIIRYRDGQPAILLIDFDGKQETLPSKAVWGVKHQHIN